MNDLKTLVDQLHETGQLTREAWVLLIGSQLPGSKDDRSRELSEYVFNLAREEQNRYYGHDVFVRGLIEFTNYC